MGQRGSGRERTSRDYTGKVISILLVVCTERNGISYALDSGGGE